MTNRNKEEQSLYLLKCGPSRSLEKNCSCEGDLEYVEERSRLCPLSLIRCSCRAVVTSFTFFLFFVNTFNSHQHQRRRMIFKRHLDFLFSFSLRHCLGSSSGEETVNDVDVLPFEEGIEHEPLFGGDFISNTSMRERQTRREVFSPIPINGQGVSLT